MRLCCLKNIAFQCQGFIAARMALDENPGTTLIRKLIPHTSYRMKIARVTAVFFKVFPEA